MVPVKIAVVCLSDKPIYCWKSTRKLKESSVYNGVCANELRGWKTALVIPRAYTQGLVGHWQNPGLRVSESFCIDIPVLRWKSPLGARPCLQHCRCNLLLVSCLAQGLVDMSCPTDCSTARLSNPDSHHLHETSNHILTPTSWKECPSFCCENWAEPASSCSQMACQLFHLCGYTYNVIGMVQILTITYICIHMYTFIMYMSIHSCLSFERSTPKPSSPPSSGHR